MLLKLVENMFKKRVYSRVEPDEAVFYFSAADFEGLSSVPYNVKSSDGHTLCGWFYSYEGCDESRIIVFEHGMGPGHPSYMREIEMLARHGYLVFAYDHTGCRESGGEGTGGFVQSLKDLDDVLTALKSDEKYSSKSFAVIGHSWGGFSTLNIAAWHPDITHAVAISGFISVKEIMRQHLGGIPFGTWKKLYDKELERNREYIETSAIEVLRTSNVPTMVIHSRGDGLVDFDTHFETLRSEVGTRENIVFVEMDKRGHNPNYTEDAVNYKNEFYAAYAKAKKKKKLKTHEGREAFKASLDWRRMTEQDTELWNKIFRFLDNGSES